MTDGPVRVMPREPLVAGEADEDGWRAVALGADLFDGTLIDVAPDEFAAHFVPADVYERLLAAVGAWADAPEGSARHDTEVALLAAYRAYVGSDT